MCEKCGLITKQIERYLRLILSIADQLTVDGAKALIVALEAEKIGLHPELLH